MSAISWAAVGIVLAVIVALTIWAAADAAREESQPATPPWTVLTLVATIGWMLVLAAVITLLRGVHTVSGWLGARVELHLRQVAAGDDPVLDDHGHPWDPENNDWQDPWRPA